MSATQSVQSYLIKADSSQGSVQNDWLILALKAAIRDGNSSQAALIIDRLAKQQLNNEQQAEWQLLRAENYMLQARPELVVQQLYFQPWWQLPDQVWQRYHRLRAQALEQVGDYFHASQELSWLYSLSSTEAQPEIAAKIWQGVTQYPAADLQRFMQQSNTWELSGWLQLALYMQTERSNLANLKAQLQNWLNANPEHPAALHIPQSLEEVLALEVIEPKNTALLLPLSGKYAKPAQLVRDGFLMAMLDDTQKEKDATLTVIDTEQTSGDELADRLKQSNIDFIVGPLVKSEIEAVQQMQAEHQQNIPMLALNFPQEISDNPDYCYLTLSPEQEVMQAAHYLDKQGYHYPLLLAPQGSNGDRAVAAFKAEWQKLQHTDVAVALFANKTQLQQSIEGVFGLKESQSRIVQMDRLLGLEMENQPRSRRDIDAVYIVANSGELTLIKPFIEVAVNPEAAPPKLFANSISNSGKRQFEDLSGVTYSDIPLLIAEPQPVTDRLEALWPDKSNTEKRLLALGMDAYTMVNELPKMKLTPEHQVEGQTGLLSMGEQCIIRRQLSWAEYEALQ